MKRPHMPLSVKLAACLDMLGLTGEKIEWEHSVALKLRPIDPETGDTIPPANDPRYIRPMILSDHKTKTNGVPHIPLSGDLSKIAKTKRIERKHAEFQARLMAKQTGEEPETKSRAKRQWPKRKFPQQRRLSK